MYNTYAKLFSEDNFTPFDEFPSNPLEYQASRELSCINLIGINYNKNTDTYAVRVPDTTKSQQYKLVNTTTDIILAIISYDEAITEFKLTNTPKYVVDGVRQFTTSMSKYFDKNVREFIHKYRETFTQADLAKMLKIPVKEVNKFIARTYQDYVKPDKSPTIVVWDVRNNYEKALSNIKTKDITTDDIDILLGLK